MLSEVMISLLIIAAVSAATLGLFLTTSSMIQSTERELQDEAAEVSCSAETQFVICKQATRVVSVVR